MKADRNLRKLQADTVRNVFANSFSEVQFGNSQVCNILYSTKEKRSISVYFHESNANRKQRTEHKFKTHLNILISSRVGLSGDLVTHTVVYYSVYFPLVSGSIGNR
ncbi:hypothetical protein CEXT_617791 [Caerostris extrusa]|uniref:Uncharacterized protein n=1 Tax=Caerostris extrusa TaxID=172846 RepID=A0AAV4PJN6_CAEEX|nr:hypothetical protein CEXT_617791 [Caerostris extrusa]